MTAPATAGKRTGWVFYDWANQVFQTSVITVFPSLYLTGVAEAAARASGQLCPGDDGWSTPTSRCSASTWRRARSTAT